MNIKLNDDYQVITDERNYILQTKKYPDPNSKFTKDPNNWKWIDVGYYGRLEHLVTALFEREIKSSNTYSFKELTEYVRKLERSVINGMESLRE